MEVELVVNVGQLIDICPLRRHRKHSRFFRQCSRISGVNFGTEDMEPMLFKCTAVFGSSPLILPSVCISDSFPGVGFILVTLAATTARGCADHVGLLNWGFPPLRTIGLLLLLLFFPRC